MFLNKMASSSFSALWKRIKWTSRFSFLPFLFCLFFYLVQSSPQCHSDHFCRLLWMVFGKYVLKLVDQFSSLASMVTIMFLSYLFIYCISSWNPFLFIFSIFFFLQVSWFAQLTMNSVVRARFLYLGNAPVHVILMETVLMESVTVSWDFMVMTVANVSASILSYPTMYSLVGMKHHLWNP